MKLWTCSFHIVFLIWKGTLLKTRSISWIVTKTTKSSNKAKYEPVTNAFKGGARHAQLEVLGRTTTGKCLRDLFERLYIWTWLLHSIRLLIFWCEINTNDSYRCFLPGYSIAFWIFFSPLLTPIFRTSMLTFLWPDSMQKYTCSMIPNHKNRFSKKWNHKSNFAGPHLLFFTCNLQFLSQWLGRISTEPTVVENKHVDPQFL